MLKPVTSPCDLTISQSENCAQADLVPCDTPSLTWLLKVLCRGASLVAQWLRICLLMQGTRVRALVWEDPTCHGAAGPVSHNY